MERNDRFEAKLRKLKTFLKHSLNIFDAIPKLVRETSIFRTYLKYFFWII